MPERPRVHELAVQRAHDARPVYIVTETNKAIRMGERDYSAKLQNK